jgi:hypothetical protein
MFRMTVVAVWAIITKDKEIPTADVSGWCVETLSTKQNLSEITRFECPRGDGSKFRTRDINLIVVILISYNSPRSIPHAK